MFRLLVLHQAVPDTDKQIHTVGELLRQFGRFGEAAAILETAAAGDADALAILTAARQEWTGGLLLETD